MYGNFSFNECNMPDLSNYTLDLSQSLIFCIVFIAMCVLVGLGKIDPQKLEYLLLILVPSPIKKDPS